MPSKSRGLIIDTILPVAVFPPLIVFALNVIFGTFLRSGAGSVIASQCSPLSARFSAGPALLAYTGSEFVDRKLCALVTFFNALMQPSNFIFNTTLMSGFSVLAVFPFIEASRQESNIIFVLVSVLAGPLYQLFTVGVILPLYWFLFILIGSANTTRDLSKRGAYEGSRVDKSHAEAIAFSLLVGFIVPTIGMLVLGDPYVTAIWQPFPVLMFVAQVVHRRFRRSQGSGHTIVRTTYFFLFCANFFIHSFYVWPLLISDRDSLRRMFVPTLEIPTTADFNWAVLNFIQWDVAFGFISSILASLWFAGSFTQLFGTVLWWAIAPILFGPGAAIAGLFMWRENTLNGGSKQAEVKKI